MKVGSEELFDFRDGKGPVAAHRHPNGGGWVSKTAKVDETAYVNTDAVVYGNAKVLDFVSLHGKTVVCDEAVVRDHVEVNGVMKVCGQAVLKGKVKIYGRSRLKSLFDNENESYAVIGGDSVISG